MKKYNGTINVHANQTWYLSLQYYKKSDVYCNFNGFKNVSLILEGFSSGRILRIWYLFTLFFLPTLHLFKSRKSRAHKKVTITREWKLMCQIMRSWIKLIYKQHNYFNLLAKAPRFCAKSRTRCYKLHKPGTVSVVSNLLYIRRESELRFRFLLSCFLISSC